MQKKKEKIGANFFQIALILIVAFILTFILVTKDKNNLKAHCVNAVCNEDNTICYNYAVNEKNNTEVTWKGDCSKLK